MVHVEDILVSPINTPLQYAQVDIVTVGAVPVLKHTHSKITADVDGKVSFELVKGDYRVYLTQRECGIKQPIGYINASVFDGVTSPVKLSALVTSQLESEVTK